MREGDVAVLFGPGDHGEPTAQDWADELETIHYEVVTGVHGARVHRTLTGDAQERPMRKLLWARRRGGVGAAATGVAVGAAARKRSQIAAERRRLATQLAERRGRAGHAAARRALLGHGRRRGPPVMRGDRAGRGAGPR